MTARGFPDLPTRPARLRVATKQRAPARPHNGFDPILRTVSCPSCGAPFRFRGASSVVGVCGYCKATLVRDGVDLANIGVQAELLEDDTPIQLGTVGRHRNQQFNVVGRIQYKYGAGVWSEWHVLFGDGKSAWLSDASREFTISYLAPPGNVPAFAELKPDQEVLIGKERYRVTNMEQAEVVAGEGELPFKFESGWKADVVDLRGQGTRFATIDYSEAVPHIYVGEKLPFDVFGFTNLRDLSQVGFVKKRAKAFKCAGCGAPIEKHLTTTEVVACSSCGTVTDVTGEVGQLVQRNERNAVAANPTIPVGSEGKWNGAQWEIVGFMRRGITVEGVKYQWGEYLLHNVQQGYTWLSEYDGHFNFIKSTAELPKLDKVSLTGRKPDARYLGKTFRHFQRAKARVDQVVGEFYWRVKVGDTATCDDYVAPPLILSSEKTDNEVTWSLGEYVDNEKLWKAFQLPGPAIKPTGVAPNQPSPHEGKVFRFWAVYLVAAVVGFILMGVIESFQRDKPATEVAFSMPASGGERVVSPVFELGDGAGRAVVLDTQSNVTGNWLALGLQLTNVDNGRAWKLDREIGFKKINDISVGDSRDVAEINNVPGGRYTLSIESKTPGSQWASDVTGRVKVYREPNGVSNWVLMAGYLLLFPLVAWGRKRSFESKRWAESDYAPGDD